MFSSSTLIPRGKKETKKLGDSFPRGKKVARKLVDSFPRGKKVPKIRQFFPLGERID